ncbi:uncharacterized protein DSM5745_10928 [Aspergillus mulundensis]|uniref:GET complex, subunit GET2 n=1 Tax=Aspergillus mulundensis TaxID=1810919 RepID=A0A3D8QFN3_9EURO|nr:Uncharacterized protein DSM5745_10928 [Aspergillus mulundensis]RDW60470.1 Uncharacterized protein DSM5745_10928 [Aspergillus mulundensis]
MSSAEESPAQRAARLRRERREAKIREGGASRLDKITSLSGRTPSKDREDASPSPSPQPPTAMPAASPEPRPTPQQPQQIPRQAPPPPSVEDSNPDELRQQQDALRALLRQPMPSQQDTGEEDPTMKLLNSLMGGMGGLPGAVPGAGPGAGADASGDSPAGLPPGFFSSLGLPPWMADALGTASKPQSEEQKKALLTWKILHITFSVVLAIYLCFLTSSSVAMYGRQPPPPATAQNPFLYFTTGELLLDSARIMTKNSGPPGPFLYIQLLRDYIRDGSIVLFLFGMGSWWNQGW